MVNGVRGSLGGSETFAFLEPSRREPSIRSSKPLNWWKQARFDRNPVRVRFPLLRTKELLLARSQKCFYLPNKLVSTSCYRLYFRFNNNNNNNNNVLFVGKAAQTASAGRAGW